MERYALVPTGGSDIAAYLYPNYSIVAETEHPDIRGYGEVLIAGTDSAGFTLEAILDRLASGLYFGREVSCEDAARALLPADLCIDPGYSERPLACDDSDGAATARWADRFK